MTGPNHYQRPTEFTALQVFRIYEMTYKIFKGEVTQTNKFDSIIALIDRVNPELTFSDLYALCERHEIKYEVIRNEKENDQKEDNENGFAS